MMGFGGYGNGGSYPSPPSSSNLSASAPPFTLDRSQKPGPIPLADLIGPTYSGPMNSSLNNWLPSRALSSDLNLVGPPSNNAYGYGGLQTVVDSPSTVVSASTDPFGYGQSSAESAVKPYYPPYVSPTTTHKDGRASFDWPSSSRGGLDGSSEWGDGLWNGFVEWKQGKQSGHGNFNSKEMDIVVPSMYENYMNLDAKIPKELSPLSVDFLEMEKLGGSLNVESLDNKDFFGKSSSFGPDDYSISVLGSLSGFTETQLQPSSLVFGPSSVSHQLPYSASTELRLKHCANDGSSAPFKILNLGSDVRNFHSESSFENKPVSDSSQLGIHLGRDDPIPLKNKEVAANDTFQDVLKAKFGSGSYNPGHDRFSLDLNINEAVGAVQGSSEGIDHYNHAVDSPCWKGVPANHSSQFDPSEDVLDPRNFEACNKFQPKQPFQLAIGGKVSPQKPNETTAYHEIGERSNDNCEYGKRSDIESSRIAKRSIREGESVNDIVEEALQYCSTRLHVPAENVISSSAEDSSRTKRNASTEGPSTPTVDVVGMVNTIHNLSEFLMSHCTRGSSQLKQKDHEVVQSAIKNLTMCMSKNAEPILPEKDTYDYVGGVKKGPTTDTCQATKRAGSVQALVDNPHSEGSDCNAVDDDTATRAFKKVLMENFNEEEETQPQTLLYKNLWLEAEAALCSVNYKARYNRMKIEFESSKFLKSKDAHENSVTTETKKPLGSVASPDSDAVEALSPKDKGCSAPKSGLSVLTPISHDSDVMSRFQILRCRIENSNPSTPTNVDKTSSSTASPRSGNVAREKTIPNPETPTQASSDITANRDINDFDASVMARFHILKSRAENLPPPAEINLPRFASQSTYWPILGSIPEIGNSGLNPASDPIEGHFGASEFRMFDPRQGQSNGGYGTENSVVYERVSLDWEHVRKEDLGWQNR